MIENPIEPSGAGKGTAPGAPRVDCGRCRRPLAVCYCAHVTPIGTRTRIVVFQHPRERRKAIGTARIAALCLPSAEILVGMDFDGHARARTLLADPEAPAVLLYPAPDARDLEQDPPKGPVTLVVIDGTWNQAKSLLRRNPLLQSLPKVAFRPERPSEYRIRREPSEAHVSTIEAMAHALARLEGGDPGRFEAMLAPFRAMVETQVGFAARVAEPRCRRPRRRSANPRLLLPAALLESRLVCLIGEANAWPHDRALGAPPFPSELVQLCAAVVGSDARIEQLLAPRLPISTSPVTHARLSLDDLARGMTVEAARAGWRGFVQPGDVLCVWGHHALGLLQRDALCLPERVIDLRAVAAAVLGARPGTLESLVERLGRPWQALGRGRGGERLGRLVAIAGWLVAAAREAESTS
jgi:DTW domain-containing protein YfiP